LIRKCADIGFLLVSSESGSTEKLFLGLWLYRT
jgi:hypothetical protein